MSRNSAFPRFYEEDTVVYAGQKEHLATVLNVWYDEDEDGPQDYASLQTDQYRIIFSSGRLLLAHASELELVDRSFQVGDICKTVKTRGPNYMVTGVVVDIKVKVALQDVNSKADVAGLVDARYIRPAADIRRDDHVIYNNWVGIVDNVFEEGLLSMDGESRLHKFTSVGGGLTYGVPTPRALDSMEMLLKDSAKKFRQCDKEAVKVVSICQTHAFITWLAINQKVSLLR
jgi:ubiquitin-conjugating enzyme E2 O